MNYQHRIRELEARHSDYDDEWDGRHWSSGWREGIGLIIIVPAIIVITLLLVFR